MGADWWEATGPWHDDPVESLRLVQQKELDEQYGLPAFAVARLGDAREALRLAQASENDPRDVREHLLEIYSEEVAFLEGVLERPLPTDLQGRLKIIRRVCGADGCGGVLDVTAINDSEDTATCRPLSDGERTVIFGTSKPTTADAEKHHARLPDPGRAGSYCYPVYDESGFGVAWHFYGRMFD